MRRWGLEIRIGFAMTERGNDTWHPVSDPAQSASLPSDAEPLESGQALAELRQLVLNGYGPPEPSLTGFTARAAQFQDDARRSADAAAVFTAKARHRSQVCREAQVSATQRCPETRDRVSAIHHRLGKTNITGRQL